MNEGYFEESRRHRRRPYCDRFNDEALPFEKDSFEEEHQPFMGQPPHPPVHPPVMNREVHDLELEILRLKFEIDYLKKSIENIKKTESEDKNEKISSQFSEDIVIKKSEELSEKEDEILKKQENLSDKIDELSVALSLAHKKLESLENADFEDALNEKFGSKNIGDVLKKLEYMFKLEKAGFVLNVVVLLLIVALYCF